jgi:predicted RNase H-like HicB family nuclease
MPEPLVLETELEVDGRWIAEVTNLYGALAYGSTREEAIAKATAFANEIREEQSGQGQ